ncbi:hypothetical protein DID88_006932 [Monilinia fructigena]|uniref:beta-glucosidase n=1 Tax=Monilinia fructigena TaxID=38457 RepID=A0A395IG30_9HELO|nr:hypothetical protein DID88_006932 [Monilinia fructigena]
MKSLLDLVLVLSGVITGDKSLLTLGLKSSNTTYPGAVDPAIAGGARFNQTSEPFYPSPWMNPNTGEKVNLTTGVGWEGEACVGNVGSIPRLGFKSLCMQDSPVGVRFADFNSVFSSGQSVAATFDRGLMYARGYAMGQEHKAKGVTVQLGPVAGPLGRAPQGGRNWEGFSPDPVLTGVGIAETIKGIQDAGIIACAKHFIGNEQEHFRQAPEAIGFGYNITESVSSNIDDVTMHETYLWPFADAVRAGVGSVMCSYNQVNNSYSCQNSKMLNNLLKGELGFQGFVMSDWQAQHSGAASAVAGLDMTMPGDILSLTPEKSPNFSSWTLDTYGPSHYAANKDYKQVNWHVDVRGDHAKLIRDIGARSTVLLKNIKNALPLSKPKFLAVIGEDAGGNAYGPNGCPDRGCDNGTLGMAWGSGSSNFPYLVTPDTALQNQALADGTVYQSILDNYATSEIEALLFTPLDLLWLVIGMTMRTSQQSCGLVVPGQESGNSITDVLYGKANPAARTPFTWGPTRESYGTDILYEPNNGELAPQDDFTRSNTYTPSTGTTEAAPTFGTFSTNLDDYVFPNGSYPYVYQYIYPYLNTSDAAASSADIHYGQNASEFLPPKATDGSAQPIHAAGGAPGGNPALYDVLYTVTAQIHNSGSIAGEEVPQLYVSLGGPNDPLVVLRGFERLSIDAGSTTTFTVDLTRRDLSNWDTVTQNWFISIIQRPFMSVLVRGFYL